ncbi:MAG: CBS domain-containing protein [Bernardetiaceae bacterium]
MMQPAEIQTQMVARELIDPLIPPLKPTDSVGKALGWMSEFHLRQLPVVVGQAYCGIISEDTLYGQHVSEAMLEAIPLQHTEHYVRHDAHFYEVMRLAEEHQMEVMPVLDEGKTFEGVISIKESVMTFVRLLTLQHPGGILVLLMEHRDYTLTQISRLVEENGAKVMSVYTEPDVTYPEMIRVTIKINTPEVGRIAATLERFNYRVVGRYEHESSQPWVQERLDSFFKFLEL